MDRRAIFLTLFTFVTFCNGREGASCGIPRRAYGSELPLTSVLGTGILLRDRQCVSAEHQRFENDSGNTRGTKGTRRTSNWRFFCSSCVLFLCFLCSVPDLLCRADVKQEPHRLVLASRHERFHKNSRGLASGF